MHSTVADNMYGSYFLGFLRACLDRQGLELIPVYWDEKIGSDPCELRQAHNVAFD